MGSAARHRSGPEREDMAKYQDLQDRIDHGDVVILDGAVGTGLQNMGVPMHGIAWAAAALQTHPFTVRQLHETYIKAGVNVLTTNTYSAARHNLEPLGLGDLTSELNIRAVTLARDARDKAARDHPVYIGGAVSNYGLVTGAEPRRSPRRGPRRTALTVEQTQANLREQAEVLAEAGVDFLLSESTGSMEHRKWVVQACLSTGLPTWIGIKCRVEGDDPTPRVGYSSDVALDRGLDELVPLGGKVINVFHSNVKATDAALPIVREKWAGPLGIYPEAGREDYVDPLPDPTGKNDITPAEFLDLARKWVQEGVQIIGGCCGIGPDYIRPLREGLPNRIPMSRGR
jgi:S-methylmethionine-dependent homocysteine/selenocysteine methylase